MDLLIPPSNTMLKLLVILFMIKLYAQINISFLCFTKITPLKSYEKCFFMECFLIAISWKCFLAFLEILFKNKKQLQRIFDNPQAKSFLKALTIFLAIYQSQSKHSRFKKKNKKKQQQLYGPFLWMGFNCLKAKESLREQLTCHN